MTCIVGLVHDSNVWIGGDSAGVGGWSLSHRADAKVFRNGPCVIGFTTSFRMGQLLRWKFEPPAHPEGMEDARYMATVFVDAMRQCFKDGGYIHKENGRETGGTFMVGYRGKLWVIEDSFQVAEFLDGYAAVGCGHEIACGSLFTSADRPPDARIAEALQAAEHHSAGVRGPFVVMDTA